MHCYWTAVQSHKKRRTNNFIEGWLSCWWLELLAVFTMHLNDEFGSSSWWWLIIHPVWYRLTRSCWKEEEVASRIHPRFQRPAVNPCYRRANANTKRRYCPLISDGVALEILVSEMWKIAVCVIRDGKDEVISFISFFFFATQRLQSTRRDARLPRENNGSVSALDSADFLSRRMRLVEIHKCDIWEPHRQQRQAAAHQTGALLSHTGFLLPDFRKIKWEKNSTASTLPSPTRWSLTFWCGRRRRSNLLGSPDEPNLELHLSIEGFYYYYY